MKKLTASEQQVAITFLRAIIEGVLENVIKAETEEAADEEPSDNAKELRLYRAAAASFKAYQKDPVGDKWDILTSHMQRAINFSDSRNQGA